MERDALKQLFDDINIQNEQNPNKFPYNIEGWKVMNGDTSGRLLYDEEGKAKEVLTYAVGFLCKQDTDTGHSEESYTFLTRSDSNEVYVFPGTYGMYNVFNKFGIGRMVFFFGRGKL